MKKLSPQTQIIPNTPDLIQIEEMNKYLKKLKIKETPRIVFFGSDPWSIYVLKALEDNFDVKAVVCAPNSPVANFFKGPMLTPDKLDEDFKFKISNLKFNLAVVASYGKIIPETILNIPKYGFLNVHPSLLPKYRGPSPVTATILNNDKETGVTIIKLDAQMDHGPTIITKHISLSGKEDFLTLINLLFQEGAKLLVNIIPDFVNGKTILKEQNHLEATYCSLLKKEDGYFEITSPPNPEKLDKMIRAYSPWPGVWTRLRLKNFGEQARIVKFLPGGLLQIEGKKPTPWKVFLNNYPDFPRHLISQ